MLGLAWVIATPIFAAPDEVAHVIRAASAIYQGAKVGCFAFEPDVTADCMKLGGPRNEVTTDTWVGHHNPAYVQGGGASRVLADSSRPDLAIAFPGYANQHGFVADLPGGSGKHTVCAYAINRGPGANTLIGCTTG